MAAEKKELNHAECAERELKEWKKIFSLSEKAYGWRINTYKGNQKLVYIPDTMDGKKVAFIHADAFPRDCGLICNKRLWDKLDYNQEVSAVSYLKFPEKFPEEFAKYIKRYIVQNTGLVFPMLVQEDNVEAFDLFLQIMGKNIDTEKMEEYIFSIENIPEIKAYVLSNKKETVDVSEKLNADLDKDPYCVGEIKKKWLYKKADDGTIILTGYKGTETRVYVPDRVGDSPVTQLGEFLFSSKRKRSTPDQQRSVNGIEMITIPDGVKSLGKGLCQWSMRLEEIYLPASVVEIGENAFSTYRGETSITVHAPAGSYAEKYAKDHNMILGDNCIEDNIFEK